MGDAELITLTAAILYAGCRANSRLDPSTSHEELRQAIHDAQELVRLSREAVSPYKDPADWQWNGGA
ncbi:MAG: hypothetical protein IT429_26010 [Gemmataceae bacterium]|nr:hypothetical protein [Gemmataceae bacterium]